MAQRRPLGWASAPWLQEAVCGRGVSGKCQGHLSGGPARGLRGPRDLLCRLHPSIPPIPSSLWIPRPRGPPPVKELHTGCLGPCTSSPWGWTLSPRGAATALPVGPAAALTSTQPCCWEGLHKNAADNLSPPLGKQPGALCLRRDTRCFQHERRTRAAPVLESAGPSARCSETRTCPSAPLPTRPPFTRPGPACRSRRNPTCARRASLRGHHVPRSGTGCGRSRTPGFHTPSFAVGPRGPWAEPGLSVSVAPELLPALTHSLFSACGWKHHPGARGDHELGRWGSPPRDGEGAVQGKSPGGPAEAGLSLHALGRFLLQLDPAAEGRLRMALWAAHWAGRVFPMGSQGTAWPPQGSFQGASTSTRTSSLPSGPCSGTPHLPEAGATSR